MMVAPLSHAHNVVDAWRDDRFHDHDDNHDNDDDDEMHDDLVSFAKVVSICLARLRKRVDDGRRGRRGGPRR